MGREIDSRYAWFRLAISVLLSALGSVGTWSVVVALPAVQAEFGTARGGASLPYTLTTIGFGLGGVLMGLDTPWAFYVKPWLMRRRKLRIQEQLAAGTYVKPGEHRQSPPPPITNPSITDPRPIGAPP